MNHDLRLKALVASALYEDVGSSDLTTELTIPRDLKGRAKAVSRAPMAVSGLEPFREAFLLYDPSLEVSLLVKDGDYIEAKTTMAVISGAASSILTAERVALNFLGRLSGIATHTWELNKLIAGTKAKLLDTRKTTPGLRFLEKAAVRHGGGQNHRFGLYDAILIKDNHIQAVGSLTEAVKRAKEGAPKDIKIGVEVDNLSQLTEALEAGAVNILLDNIEPLILAQAVSLARDFSSKHGVKVILETSGGVNCETILEIAQSGVDLISVGALTHSSPCADVGLDWE
ncbi:MAG: carboxylating nicotinate-nucleotide diphosphorylase [Deltaproteobacteria bacterium]|jgi:nicotinate-nucleotide pyrophosphorylase (carboxylating)|nr:carboxylating nicotinate-nucleotide diphosphorylase [Deltaproteobacteria bacterium]